MGQKILYLFIITLTFVWYGCDDEIVFSENPLPEMDNYVGEASTVDLAHVLEVFDEGIEYVLHITTSDGNKIKRSCNVSHSKTASGLRLMQGLKDGTYRLMSLEYTLPKPLAGGKFTKGHIGLGCAIKIHNKQVSVSDYYDRDLELYGQGTSESPYIIACDQNLRTLAKKVNDSRYNKKIDHTVFFKQYADTIDLEHLSFVCDNKQGWSPIGTNPTVPFKGNYDGNHKVIKGLDICRYEDAGVGLFGFTTGAYIKNVKIQDSRISGNIAVGALIGSVTTEGGERSCTFVDSCQVLDGVQVIGTEEKGGVATGGLIGCVDMNSKVIVTNCSTDANAQISSCFNAGGIIGTTGLYATVLLSDCINNASVTSQYSGCGGLIASGDTVSITSCKNYGDITGSIAYNGAEGTVGIGTGGLIGGSGISIIASSVNYGKVEGKEGVGGIIGSTRVSGSDTEAYTFNNLLVAYCGNTGAVKGTKAVGGICGEAQLAASGVFNNGKVSGDEYTAGIVGRTSVGLVENSINTGDVFGRNYTAGIVGKCYLGSFAINQNYGNIIGSGGYTAGILALGGNNTMMNYCSNHGNIGYGASRFITRSGASGPMAGIVAEIGDPSEWTNMDTFNCVLGATEMALGFLGGAVFSGMEATGGARIVVLAIKDLADAACWSIDMLSFGFAIDNIVGMYELEEKMTNAKEKVKEQEIVIQSKLKSLRAEYGKFTISNTFYADAFGVDYLNNVNKLVDYYVASDSNVEQFNDNINTARNELSEEVSKASKAHEIVHTAIAGVCLLTSTAVGIASIFVTGGTSAAIVLAGIGGIATVVGGGNTIIKTITDFAENAVIISQCVNTGNVEDDNTDNKKVAGIVGILHDNAIVSDCLNSGSGSSGNCGGHIAGVTKAKSRISNCLTIAPPDAWAHFMADTPPIGSYDADNNYYFNGKSTAGSRASESPTGLSLEDLKNPEKFSGWDFSTRWTIPAAEGGFPIPNKSEYQ